MKYCSSSVPPATLSTPTMPSTNRVTFCSILGYTGGTLTPSFFSSRSRLITPHAISSRGFSIMFLIWFAS